MHFQTRREYLPVGSGKTSLFCKVWKCISSPLTLSRCRPLRSSPYEALAACGAFDKACPACSKRSIRATIFSMAECSGMLVGHTCPTNKIFNLMFLFLMGNDANFSMHLSFAFRGQV
jgi:hypothetical protein